VIPTLRNTNNAAKNTSRPDEDTADPDTTNNTSISGSNEAVVPDQADQSDQQQQDYDPIDGTEEMSEREVREAALMNDILGKQIVTKLYSKNFQNREDAIEEVHKNLVQYRGDEARALFRASAILVAKMSKDNVFSIFNNSLRLFQYLLNEFIGLHQALVGRAEISYALEKCLPVLLQRTGDTNARLRQRSHEYIVEMASFKEVM